jgi:hypothetical protein
MFIFQVMAGAEKQEINVTPGLKLGKNGTLCINGGGVKIGNKPLLKFNPAMGEYHKDKVGNLDIKNLVMENLEYYNATLDYVLLLSELLFGNTLVGQYFYDGTKKYLGLKMRLITTNYTKN